MFTRVAPPAPAQRAPTISVRLHHPDGHSFVIHDVIPDSGAKRTVAGLDLLLAFGFQEKDFQNSTVKLVVADKKSPLLSIGQCNVPIKYGGTEAIITIIFCPEIFGFLLSWRDCINLAILPRNFPHPIIDSSVVVSVTDVGPTPLTPSLYSIASWPSTGHPYKIGDHDVQGGEPF